MPRHTAQRWLPFVELESDARDVRSDIENLKFLHEELLKVTCH